jgi:hypothetical protein
MRNKVIAVAAVAAAACISASASRAAELPASRGKLACRCERNWAPREYWRWDHRPIWDDPWAVLKPNFWGSPEPHLVPANIWVRKWRLRWPWRHRHWHSQ